MITPTWNLALSRLGLKAAAALPFRFSQIQVVSEWDTLEELGRRRASIARYGDGEMEVILGNDIHFQHAHPSLAARLLAILRQPTERCLIGIPNFEALQIKSEHKRRNWLRYQRMYALATRRGATYYSAFISRPASIQNLESETYYAACRDLFPGRSIVYIGHTPEVRAHWLFNAVRSITYVQCPARDAFGDYERLLAEACAFLSEPEVLFLIAAGPTACLLVKDLSDRGAQALDIGHLTRIHDEFMARQVPLA